MKKTYLASCLVAPWVLLTACGTNSHSNSALSADAAVDESVKRKLHIIQLPDSGNDVGPFKTFVDKLDIKKNVVIQFSSSLCGPCKTVKEQMSDLAKRYAGDKFVFLYVEKKGWGENSSLFASFAIEGLPTLVQLEENPNDEMKENPDRYRIKSQSVGIPVNSTIQEALNLNIKPSELLPIQNVAAK